MSGLLLGIVLSVCTYWFHNMVTLPPWLVSTDFGTCSYQCFIIIIIIIIIIEVLADPQLIINTRLPQTLALGLCTVPRNLGYPRLAADPVLIYIYHCPHPERGKGKKSILGVWEENCCNRKHVCLWKYPYVGEKIQGIYCSESLNSDP